MGLGTYIKGTGTADLLQVFDNTRRGEVFTIKDGGKIEVKFVTL